MEEQEGLPRREAALGVGLLGVLLIGLVGTIVIRIVHAKPRRGAAPAATTWASQSSPMPTTSPADLPRNATTLVEEDALPATPIPTVDSNEAIVAPVSTTEAGDAGWESAPLAPRPPAFVAPSGVASE